MESAVGQQYQRNVWQQKGVTALSRCEQAIGNLISLTTSGALDCSRSPPRNALIESANLAANAWGSAIMGGHECCTLNTSPHCVTAGWSALAVVTLSTLGLGFLAVAASLAVASCRGSTITEPTQIEQPDGKLGTPANAAAPARDTKHAAATSDMPSYGRIMPVAPDAPVAPPEVPALASDELRRQLVDAWVRRSCLRVLPGAEHFAKATASLFNSLQRVFDFQRDSVFNQHEHLLSMWRSHCAMVADRTFEANRGEDRNRDRARDEVEKDRGDVDEKILLSEALGDLHADLMDGFSQWQSKLHAALQEEASTDQKTDGVVWTRIPASACGSGEAGRGNVAKGDAAELSTQLEEIVTYLLVWGEAGNLRFMPEAVYCLTSLALAAGTGDPYSGSETHSLDAEHGMQSSRFLARVIRPIYNAVFDEWYSGVHVDDKGKDVKVMHKGFEAFLPADAANYDDWNELFCDHRRLIKQLQLKDGSSLFALPPRQRFAALASVDWRRSLRATDTKTHREVHSFWGVFAATHRVWLAHAVLFFAGTCAVAQNSQPWQRNLDPVLSSWARFASVGLIVPFHGLVWGFAKTQVTGHAFRGQFLAELYSCRGFIGAFLSVLPALTYVALRYATEQEAGNSVVAFCLAVHYLVALIGLVVHLFVPSSRDRLWDLTLVPLRRRAARYLFWLGIFSGKFAVGLLSLRAVQAAIIDLDMTLPGYESPADFTSFFYGAETSVNSMLWLFVWFTSFLLYVVDTQLWFCLGCTVLGVIAVFAQRGLRCWSFAVEDAVAKIPERFSKKVLDYSPEKGYTQSPHFAPIWDRVVEYLRYEDHISDEIFAKWSFADGTNCASITWDNLTRKLRQDPDETGLGASDAARCSQAKRKQADKLKSSTAYTEGFGEEADELKQPEIFRSKGTCDIFFKHYCGVPDPQWPRTPDVQWRIVALARGLGLPMPRPFKAPYFPGLTVLIPHYGETILMRKEELLRHDQKGSVPLMDWVKDNWTEEFSSFTSRMQAARGGSLRQEGVGRIDSDADSDNFDMQAAVAPHGGGGWRMAGEWETYSDDQWKKLSSWSSMRMQTLWRTVAGMCMYHPALQCHYDALVDEGKKLDKLAHQSVWDPSDCFTCLVSMQMYKFFNESEDTRLKDTSRMLQKFPNCLKVAFIDNEVKGNAAMVDGVHSAQERRYFSCLIDKTCADGQDGRKHPRLRIELPGYPILGDGKSDNQNHAIPFMRGTLAQCIDANQGAYFEQMLLLPCVLGEFRSNKRGDGRSKRIVGFPEHITSDIGSVGDMAASAEQAFGTILQRSYAVLGARMHYGHPDIMNKIYMMQQGGVSKATKTLNLSEDIFAGMDFTLRGDGRKIRHCEYFHLAKGRDLGFNTVLAFFSKLASGSGEQILTRQMFRLHQVLHLPECLSFFYAHVGYYLNQFFISWSSPLLVCCWLLVLLSDCEGSFDSFQHCTRGSSDGLAASQVMARTLGLWFSWLLLLFIIATSTPLVMEIWMERSLKLAMVRLMKQILTLSPLLFIFQAKVIGTYVVSELRTGGATYVSTGRGLPTERRPFLGDVEPKGIKIKKVGGLYLDYASIAYYDGATLLVGCILVVLAGGMSDVAEHIGTLTWIWVSLALIIASWLCAPFLFNPYQFERQYFFDDLRCWLAFFTEKGGQHWVQWYDKKLSKPCGSGRSFFDIAALLVCVFSLTWYSVLSLKINALTTLYSELYFSTQVFGPVSALHLIVLVPPALGSFAYSVLVSCMECCCQCLCSCRGNSESQSVEDRSQVAGEKGCKSNFPLALSAVCVLALDFGEAWLALIEFYFVGWKRATITGLVLKFALLSACVHLGEAGLCSDNKQRLGCIWRPFELWVHAHRMGRDILTSSLILCVLCPLVLLNTLNDCFCRGCSVHQLLIYRNTGHQARDKVTVRKKNPIVRAMKSFRSERGRSEWRSEVSDGKSDKPKGSFWKSEKSEGSHLNNGEPSMV